MQASLERPAEPARGAGQALRIALASAVFVMVLWVLSGVASASNHTAFAELGARPLSTPWLIGLTAAGFLPALVMVLRERRRSASPAEQ